jgi:LAO/AO transport system kinase
MAGPVPAPGSGPSGGPSGLEALLAGDQATLARALSHLERGGPDAEQLAAQLRSHAGRALVVGFTGPPGAGKSSLIASFVATLRERGERVAVVAVDPSSPVTGGALLGDRTRMGAHSVDPGVYIRSVASRGQSGGLARSIPGMIDALDAAGWPFIVLETVGSGQSDIEVIEFADVGVLLSVPGLGDDIQALKAGMLELADILVVNKSDLPGADTTARHLERMLTLRANGSGGPRRPAVIRTSTVVPEGVASLLDAVEAAAGEPDRAGAGARVARRLRRALVRGLEDEFAARLGQLDEVRIEELCAEVLKGGRSLHEVIGAVLAELTGVTGPSGGGVR